MRTLHVSDLSDFQISIVLHRGSFCRSAREVRETGGSIDQSLAMELHGRVKGYSGIEDSPRTFIEDSSRTFHTSIGKSMGHS